MTQTSDMDLTVGCHALLLKVTASHEITVFNSGNWTRVTRKKSMKNNGHSVKHASEVQWRRQ